jgi:signal transduction histidine kinase
MSELIAFSFVPLAALLGSAVFTLAMAYHLGDWRPVLFVVVLLVMAVHQGNEIQVFLDRGANAALSGFGEYPETTANLLASIATVLLLRFVKQERDLAETLEERVQERTEELESFTYSVSHDLRTPLRAIDGYAQLLRKHHAGQLDEEGRRFLDLVYQNTQRMGALIDDLLTLSRLGRRELERDHVDVAALAQEAYDELCQARPDRCDAVSLTVQSLPDAVGDRSMIRHVLTNLLSNALKFAQDEDPPRIEVGTTNPDGKPVFFVRDNGVGFDPEYADKLFGVFERLHDEDAFEGTGVGLALVERIVRRHGGSVWAEGRPGEGATIYFTLPQSIPTDNE